MSAIGPKRTSLIAPHMSAFGGKAEMAFFGMSLSRSLLGVKRTWLFAAHMSAYDPKRTLELCQTLFQRICNCWYHALLLNLRERNEAAQVHRRLSAVR